jgi:hypothetical protein
VINESLVKPDRVRAIAKVTILGMASEVGMIGLGEKQYMTNPLNQKWQETPPEARLDLDLTRLFDAETGIAAILQGTSWTLGSSDGSYDVLNSRMPYDQLRALSFGQVALVNSLRAGSLSRDGIVGCFRSPAVGTIQVDCRLGTFLIRIPRRQIPCLLYSAAGVMD